MFPADSDADLRDVESTPAGWFAAGDDGVVLRREPVGEARR